MSHFNFDSETKSKSFELPGARPHYNPDRPGQVEHIFLDLVLDIPNSSLEGTCTITLNPIRNGIDRLILDAVALNIDSVKIEDIEPEFHSDGEKLEIYLTETTEANKPLKIAIAYSVKNPQRGIYFIKPDKHYPDKPTQVWTQGEDEDSRFWFPCFDYPGQLATSEIRVKVPKKFIAISNGELINKENSKNSKTYHWLQKEIHPTYLITLAVGEFAEIKDEWNDKPVTYYVEKKKEKNARISMGKTLQAIDFFSHAFGYAYPYPKYAQVCVSDFIFGGMENTSTTLLTDRCLLDERAAIDNRKTESLVVHELAHQWFGDLVVIKHWSHAWIKEGMASYAEVLWTEKEYGEDDGAYYMLKEARSYISEDSSRYRRPMVTHIYREAIELYDRHIYEKGACVYNMIRAELGQELFEKAIHTFVRDNAHKTVETIDLLRAIDKATGRNLTFLFDQYVYRGGHPDYKLNYAWDNNSNLAKLTVTQNQIKNNKNEDTSKELKELFDLKISIAFGFVKNKQVELKTFPVRVCEQKQTFYFPLEEKPKFISFDAGNNYLKTVKLEYPVAELKAQLEYDSEPVSRIYAAEALAKKGGLEAVKALGRSLKKDRFWGVRVEVAKQLPKVKLDGVFEQLVIGLDDEDARVRLAVVEALGEIKTQESYKALKPLVEKGDPSYYVEAAAAGAIAGVAVGNSEEKPSEEKVIKLLKAVLEEKEGWNEIVRSGAIAGLSKMKTSQDALNLILKYTVSGVPQPLRLAAIRALGSISTGQSKADVERILQRLEELSQETFFLTQMSVLGALGQMETERAIAILQALADRTPDGRIRRRASEAVEKVQKKVGSDRATKLLRQEMDKLKKDNQELKSRLENLEAKAKNR